MPNPYFHSNMIDNYEMFFGREHLLRRMYDLIGSEQNISITGLRRIGKSSLLSCMRLREIQNKYSKGNLDNFIFVFLDLEQYNRNTPESFLKFLVEQITREVEKKSTINYLKTTQYKEFGQVLGQTKELGFHTVLLLDEFDSITRNPSFDLNFFGYLRSLANAKLTSYVTASHKPLAELSHQNVVSSPFFNIFHFFSLGPLDKNEAVELITIPSNANACRFSERDIDFVLHVAGRHPFFIQKTCYFLFEKRMNKSKEEEIDYDQVVYETLEQLKVHFEYMWTHLTVEEYRRLEIEAQYSILASKFLPELTESALFRQFVHDKTGISTNTITRTIDEKTIKECLKNIYDRHFLGVSSLSYLKSVYVESSQQVRPESVVERGMLVSRLLEKIVEQLRPQGDVNYGAREWRTYLILRDRYFKEGISNEQLAARLGLGIRQFHRWMTQAHKDLLYALLEFEARI